MSVATDGMLESFPVDGTQKHVEGPPRSRQVRGQSITDPCLGRERTVRVLERVAEAVAAARDAPVA